MNEQKHKPRGRRLYKRRTTMALLDCSLAMVKRLENSGRLQKVRLGLRDVFHLADEVMRWPATTRSGRTIEYRTAEYSILSDEIKIQFIAAMATRGLSLPRSKDLVADAQWHRCDTPKGGEGNANGSYRLSLDGPVPWGFFRNWQDGEGVSYWRGDRSRPLTETERAELERHQEQARKEHDTLAAELAAAAAKKAASMFFYVESGLDEYGSTVKVQPALEDHPYLKRKQIQIKPLVGIIGLDKYGNLLVPMFVPGNDKPVNIQFISSNGTKLFLKGGQTKGCYLRIPGDLDRDRSTRIIIAEGFATGASIAQATGAEVHVAFSASNLEAVASAVRRHLKDFYQHGEKLREEAVNGSFRERGMHEVQFDRPQIVGDQVLIMAADDDWKTKDNP